jgi:hypothetical protein
MRPLRNRQTDLFCFLEINHQLEPILVFLSYEHLTDGFVNIYWPVKGTGSFSTTDLPVQIGTVQRTAFLSVKLIFVLAIPSNLSPNNI